MSKSVKCSVCSEKCHAEPNRRPSIYCGTCKFWVHWNCNGISDVYGKQWGQIEVEYVCVSCRTCDDGSYDFLMASQRLSKASHYGLKKFTAAAEAEKMFLRNVPLEIPPEIKTFQFHMQDPVANTLLARFHCSQLAALESTGDGNCLYNAISLLLTGNENMSTELRYRSAIELATNKRKIMQNPMFSRFSVEDELNKEILKCPRNGAYSSMINFLAVSSMLQMPINVVYPAVNSARTYLFKSTNCTIRFPFADPSRILNIMWSSTSLPSSRPTAAKPWKSNHIVPLVDLPRGPVMDMGPAFAVGQYKRQTQTKLETYNRFSVLGDEDKQTVRTATKTAPTMSVAKTTSAERSIEQTLDLNTSRCEIKSESSVLSSSKQFEERGAPSPVGNHFFKAAMHHATSFSDTEYDSANKSSMFIPTEISTPLSRSILTNKRDITCISEPESSENIDTTECNEPSWTLPRAQHITDLPIGKTLVAEELYKIVNDKSKLCQSVPCGDKSNSYVVVDNSRNMNQIKDKKGVISMTIVVFGSRRKEILLRLNTR